MTESSDSRSAAASAPLSPLMSKGEYAARCGRHPSAVSHWIADGRLRPPALVGHGRYARINWRLADQMLVEELDPSQQLAQSRPAIADLDDEEEDQGVDFFDDPRASPSPRRTDKVSEVSEDRRRQLKARADREEHAAQLAQIQLQKEAGRWIEVAAAERAWSQESAKIIDRIEGSFGQLADDLAAGETDPRSILLALRAWFRGVRTNVAAEATSFAPDPGEGEEEEIETEGEAA